MKKRKAFLFGILTIALASETFVNEPMNARAALKLNKSKLTIKIGKRKSLKAKGIKKKLSWKTSDKKIATVSSNGIVTAIKKGTATITVSSGAKHARCKVIIIGKNDYSSVLTEKKIRKLLLIPQKAKITVKYGKTFYKNSFGATLVPVEVYEHGKKVAGASFLVKNGELGCNVGTYGYLS